MIGYRQRAWCPPSKARNDCMDQSRGRYLRQEGGRNSVHLLFGREDLRGEPPIAAAWLLHGHHYVRLREGKKLSGDLFISPDTVRTNAEQFNAPYETELYRVIIHGILHLCGINDKGRENAKSWKPQKTKHWKCGKISCNSYFCKGLKHKS